MTKKISTLVLALIMIFALGSQVFAEDVSAVNTRGMDVDLNRTDTNMNNMLPGDTVPGTRSGMNTNRTNTNNLYNDGGVGVGLDARDGARTGLNGINDNGRNNGSRGLMTNNMRTRAVDNNNGWGWIGILGLIGLAGMAGRNRATDRDR